MVALFLEQNAIGEEFNAHSEHFLQAGDKLDIPLVFPAPGAYAITIEQQNIDVVVTVRSPDDVQPITINNPLPFHLYDTFLINANSLEPYSLQLFAKAGYTQGHIKIYVKPLAATPIAHHKALVSLTRAASLAHQHEKNFQLRKEAVLHYEHAIEYWQALDDRVQLGHTHASLAALLLRTEKSKESLIHFTLAIKLLERENNHHSLAVVYTDQGYAHMELSDYDSARESFEQAQRLAEQINYRRLEAWNMNNVGYTLLELGKLERALEWIQPAHTIFSELGDRAGQAMTLNNIATANNGLGFPDLAINNWKQALSLNKGFGDPLDHAATAHNLGSLYRQLGEYDDALLHFEIMTALSREIGNKRELGRNLNSTAWVYISIGDHVRARSLFEEALELRQSIGDRQGEAFTLNALGILGIEQQRWAEAKEALEQARVIFNALKLPDGQISNLTARAQLQILQGKPEMALPLLNKAITRLDDTDNARGIGDLAVWRGKALLALGDIAAAQKSFDDALVITRSRRQEIGQAQALYGKALAYYAANDLNNAMNASDNAILIIESMRANLGNPHSRGLLLETLRGVYDLRINLWMQLHSQNPEAGHNVSALLAAESARGRMFLDFLQVAGIDLYGMADQAQMETLTRVRRRLAIQVDQQVNGLNNASAQEKLNRDIFDTRASLDGIEAQIRASHARISTVAPVILPELADMQKLLDSNEALLEYALGEERSFLWVLLQNSVHSFELPGRDEVETLARDFYTQLRTLDASAVAMQSQRQLAIKLSKILLSPAYELLQDKTLVIVPDGALHYVPFAALPVPTHAKSTRYEPLLVKHEIATIPSASSMVAMRRLYTSRPASKTTLAMIADPVFNDKDPRLQRGVQSLASSAGTRTSLDRIPWTRDEANAITALVPSNNIASAFDFDATREFLLDKNIANYRVIHIATHGYLNHRQPRLSGLVLSRYNSTGEPIEGNVHLQDIFNLELSADLVVLSACESALGEEIRGEGLVGITRGFMYAGVPRAIASMWLVKDDNSTVQFMEQLYMSMLSQGMSPAAALRHAQLSLKEKRNRRDPYYWAAFSLLGDWNAPATPLNILHANTAKIENND